MSSDMIQSTKVLGVFWPMMIFKETHGEAADPKALGGNLQVWKGKKGVILPEKHGHPVGTEILRQVCEAGVRKLGTLADSAQGDTDVNAIFEAVENLKR